MFSLNSYVLLQCAEDVLLRLYKYCQLFKYLTVTYLIVKKEKFKICFLIFSNPLLLSTNKAKLLFLYNILNVSRQELYKYIVVGMRTWWSKLKGHDLDSNSSCYCYSSLLTTGQLSVVTSAADTEYFNCCNFQWERCIVKCRLNMSL